MAIKDYDALAKDILKNVGGTDNIKNVAHCITRLRLKLKDESIANTETIKNLKGVVTVMQANGQYQVVIGNEIENVYDAFLKVSGLTGGGEVAADDDQAEEQRQNKTASSVIIDLISGIFAPVIGALCAAGIMKGILALATFLVPSFAKDGAYVVLNTIGDGFFYFLPVILGFTAAKKFKMNEFTGIGIGLALVYPTMVALTKGEVVGSISLGIAGKFSWYSTFFGLPIIMPAAGYTTSVIPVILMVWFASIVEHWCKSWMPNSVKGLFIPLITLTCAVVIGYLIIGPVATLITNLLMAVFSFIFNLPVVGSIVGCTLVGGFWMVLVIFGFHWSILPIFLLNLTNLGHDYTIASMIGTSFSLGAVVFAMYLKNKDEDFRGVAVPAMISAFFFGITEPAIYGVALPNKRAMVNACIGAAVGGFIVGISGAVIYFAGGAGMLRWISFIDPSGTMGATYMIWAIIASLVSAVVGFVLEFISYKPKVQNANS